MAILNGKFPDRSFYLDHIPQRVRNYIRMALNVDPAARYQSVLDFLNDLAGVEINYDWYFSQTANGPVWYCVKDEKEYKVQLIVNQDSSCEILTTKKVPGGAERKIKEYTRSKLDQTEAYKSIKEALHKKDL